jgi:hypothetical protein
MTLAELRAFIGNPKLEFRANEKSGRLVASHGNLMVVTSKDHFDVEMLQGMSPEEAEKNIYVYEALEIQHPDGTVTPKEAGTFYWASTKAPKPAVLTFG